MIAIIVLIIIMMIIITKINTVRIATDNTKIKFDTSMKVKDNEIQLPSEIASYRKSG